MFTLLNNKQKIKKVDRYKNLANIRYSNASMVKDDLGPRVIDSFFISFVLTALTSLPISFLMNKYGINYYLPMLIAGIASVSFTYSYLMSSTPKTWKEHLDLLLSQYEPVNKHAFSDLQANIKKDGWRAEAIYEWIALEKSQLIADDLKKSGLAPSLFLEKDLG